MDEDALITTSCAQFVHVRRPSARRQTAYFLRTTEGRDAGLVRSAPHMALPFDQTNTLLTASHASQRLLQYSLRLALYLRKNAFTASAHVRLLALVSTLAAIRRLLALQDLITSVRQTLPKLAPRDILSSPSPGSEATLAGDRRPYLESLASVAQASLDLLAVVTDNLYLFSRFGLLPLSPRRTQQVDKISDFAALASAGIGLAVVARKNNALMARGRTARRKAVESEKKLEELEFWEGGGIGGESTASVKDMVTEREERVREERRLRERIRAERRKMRVLRGEMGQLRWDRLRLTAEAIFACELAVSGFVIASLTLASQCTTRWTLRRRPSRSRAGRDWFLRSSSAYSPWSACPLFPLTMCDCPGSLRRGRSTSRRGGSSSRRSWLAGRESFCVRSSCQIVRLGSR